MRRFPFLDRYAAASVLSLYLVCMLLYVMFKSTATTLPVSKAIFPITVQGDPRLVAAFGYTVGPSSHVVHVDRNRVFTDFPPGVQGKLVGGFLYNDIKDANDNILSRREPGYSSPLLVDEDPLRQEVLVNYAPGTIAAPPQEEIPPPETPPTEDMVADKLDEYFTSGQFLQPVEGDELPLDLERALKPVSYTEDDELAEPGADVLEILQRLFVPLVLVLPIVIISNLFALIISREKFAGMIETFLSHEGRWSYLSRRLAPLLAVTMALEGAVLISMGVTWVDTVATTALLLPMAAVYFLANLAVVVVCSSATQISNLIILANMTITTYFVIPAFFPNVSERAALTPLAAVMQVVNQMPLDQDATLRALSFTLLLAGVLAFWLALLFRGERLVATSSLTTSLSSALHYHAGQRGFLPIFFLVYGASAVLVGFVLQAGLATALARGAFLFPAVITLFVLMEEALKAWPLAALSLPERVAGREVAYAALIGAGFFLCEKFIVLLYIRTIYGIDYLYALLHALFQTRALYTSMLVHPLATALFAHLHLRRGYDRWTSLAAAFALHLGHNALVMAGVWS